MRNVVFVGSDKFLLYYDKQTELPKNMSFDTDTPKAIDTYKANFRQV